MKEKEKEVLRQYIRVLTNDPYEKESNKDAKVMQKALNYIEQLEDKISKINEIVPPLKKEIDGGAYKDMALLLGRKYIITQLGKIEEILGGNYK
jgi:hypothetical protein